MEKQELIDRLKNANFSDTEIEEVLGSLDISTEAKENIAIITQIGISAKDFIGELAKQLKESIWKIVFDLILIGLFLGTLIFLSCNGLITEQNTTTLFALIAGYVLAKFKKGFNM